VQRLVPGGAAEASGIKESDVILSVDGKEVNAASELQSYIARKHPGDEVTLKIFRNGSITEKKVTLRSRKDEKLTAKDTGRSSEELRPDREAGSKTVSFENLGLSVRALQPDERKELGVDRGVMVAGVERYSEAFERGLQQGDVILEADKKEIGSPSDLKGVIEKHKKGDAVLLRVKRGSGQMAFVAVQIGG